MRFPRKTSGYKSEPINEIIDYLEASKLLPSSDHRAEQTTKGMVLRNIEKPTYEEDYPFKVMIGGNEIRVTQGKWIRNGIPLTLAVDVGKTYKTLTAAVEGAWEDATDYTVYVVLEDSTSTNDPATAPNQISVYASKNGLPSDAKTRNIIRELAVCSAVDTDGYITLNQPSRAWHGGNIDDIGFVVDSDSNYDDGGDPAYYSLGLAARVDRHYRNVQIANWDSPGEDIPIDADLFMFRQDASVNKALKYCSLSQLADDVAGSIGGGGGGVGYSLFINRVNEDHSIVHEYLAFENDEITFPPMLGIGISGGNTDHDDVYWRAYDDRSLRAGHSTFVDNKTFKTSGLLEITNSTAASAGAGAIYTAGGIAADVGLYVLKGAAAQAGYFESGALKVYLGGGPTYTGALEVEGEADFFSSGHTGEAYLGGTSYPIDVSQGTATSSINVSGNYAVGGVQGKTLGGISSGGIITGGSAFRIRVLDADTGEEKDIQVLGVAI